MGEHTLAVPMELFALNRRRLWDCLRTKAPRGVVILEGGRDVDLHDTDVNFVFQQDEQGLTKPQPNASVGLSRQDTALAGVSCTVLWCRVTSSLRLVVRGEDAFCNMECTIHYRILFVGATKTELHYFAEF
ncbi:hypothetical protein J6590_013971 [Homalodisca vitripennis]|nr:hypothetical protein J6590_013971 [Homalodisca vitripennis]